MEKYIKFVEKFHENNQNELDFINNQLKKHLSDNVENQTEIEEILDFIYSNKKSYKNIGYKTILEKTKAWHKKLAKLETKDDEVVGVDYEIVKDFGDGFKFVKLISQNSYNREGKLMSHCVASYYGRDVAIYSLRDKRNNPHCTIEENNQVKGKGNQSVDNKYFGYCIKFLEEMGFSIGENEMQNIGYYKLDNIDTDLYVEDKYLYDGKYISEKNLDKIKDQDGDTYNGFGLFNIKRYIEIKGDFSIKFNFDINILLNYFNRKIKYNVANEYSSTAVANGSYSTAVANGINSIALCRGDNSTAQGKLGSRLIIAEYYNSEIINIVSGKVDGKKLKENTLYKVLNGKFVEVKKDLIFEKKTL